MGLPRREVWEQEWQRELGQEPRALPLTKR